MLGGPDAAADVQGRLAHTLGNLTLTGYNSSLGNKTFNEKRNRKDQNDNYIGYRNGLSLNADVVDEPVWTEQQIASRGERLINRVLEVFPPLRHWDSDQQGRRRAARVSATEISEGVSVGEDRWVEVTPSQFPHEAEGLRIVRDLMPKRAPFRAWTNFEFRDDRGTWSEVDLLILAPDGLHLVELKYYSGRLRGTDTTWLRDGHAAPGLPAPARQPQGQAAPVEARRHLRRLEAWPEVRPAATIGQGPHPVHPGVGVPPPSWFRVRASRVLSDGSLRPPGPRGRLRARPRHGSLHRHPPPQRPRSASAPSRP